MADINDLFELFPDYNVFDGSTTPPEQKSVQKPMKKPKPVQPKNAQHNGGSHHKNLQSESKSNIKKAPPNPQKISTRRNTQQRRKASSDIKRGQAPVQKNVVNPNIVNESVEERKSREDYRDGYGIYHVEKEIKQNFSTILYFPLLFLILEGALRFGCNQNFLSINLLYIFLFSIPVGCIFTIICSFGKARFNRRLVRIFSLIITLWYCFQIIYSDITKTFFVVSAKSPEISFENFINSLVNQRFALLIAVVPVVFFTLLGRFAFPFKKTKAPAKIVLVLLAVLFQISGLVAINFTDSFSQGTNTYKNYYGYSSPDKVQENFGLLTLEEIDISHLFIK